MCSRTPWDRRLRQRENLPVIPIAVVLYPGRAGIARETYEDVVLGQTILTFRYLQISLPLLEAAEYVQADSVLGAGLASVMRVPTAREAQIALHLTALRRVRAAVEAGQVDARGRSCWSTSSRPTCRSATRNGVCCGYN